MLRTDTKTASSRVQKGNARLSRLKWQIPYLCTSFKCYSKQRRDMITVADQRQIEAITEIPCSVNSLETFG